MRPTLIRRSRFRIENRFIGRLDETLAATNRVDVRRIDADAALGAADGLKAHDAVDLGVDLVVLPKKKNNTNPELGPALPNHDRPRPNELSVGTLDAESLRLAITTVARAADAFLVCHSCCPFSPVNVLGVDGGDSHPRQ